MNLSVKIVITCKMAWAAYRAEKALTKQDPLPITALLPLFRDSANTAAMIKHCLTVVRTAVHEVNPGQIPAVAMDQLLFALAIQIQCYFPGQYGEDKFGILMGGLHIEMAALRIVGHWLDGSGWTHCLSQAGVATSGVAESFTYASHVKRTRHAHTVTALYVCLKRSYLDYCKQQNGNVMMSFDEWREERKTSSIQFRFWDIALELELLVLPFVRSIREGHFKLYIDCLQKLLPFGSLPVIKQIMHAGCLCMCEICCHWSRLIPQFINSSNAVTLLFVRHAINFHVFRLTRFMSN
jgi:hypothetical protein